MTSSGSRAIIDLEAAATNLDARGFFVCGPLLSPGECAALVSLHGDEARFRTRIVMARHGFGLGEYKYFAYPLPPVVEDLRQALYRALVPVANRWAERL